MRKLMWFTVGFVIACAVGVYLLSDTWLLLLGIICLASSVSFLFIKTKHSKIISVILLGLVIGVTWLYGYQRIRLDTVRKHDGKTVRTTIEVTDYSYPTDYGIAFDGKIRLEGKRYNIRCYLAGEKSVCPGDQVKGNIRLRMTLDGGKQDGTYHQGDGIFLLGYVRGDVELLPYTGSSDPHVIPTFRRDILDLIEKTFPGDTFAFAKALLLGDGYDLTYEQDTAFKLSGIRHVIAVSGLHVSILFSLVYFVTGRKRLLTMFLGIPVLVLFAALAGFTPSVVRACIMQGLMILALLLNKEYDPPTALATAVLVMLACNPITITSVGFQLSAGSVLGIFLFSQKISNYLRKGKMGKVAQGDSFKAKCVRWGIGSVSVTLSALSITTPLCAIYFGTVSLVGILTNLLTLWVVSFVFYGVMLACVLGAVYLPLGKMIAWLIAWPIRYVQGTANIMGRFPLAAVYTCSVYIVVWLVVTYLLVAAFIITKKRRPKFLVLTVVLSLVIAVGASYIEPRLDDYRVTVLDVGQGQCILLQSNGKYYLVDCGGDDAKTVADEAAELLLSQGVTRLDGVILTHYDEDHTGGVIYLSSRIDVNRFYLPDISDEGTIRESLSARYDDRICWISKNTEIVQEELKITIFPADITAKGNERCQCILFQRENCDILITGDRSATGERALLKQTTLPQLELLVVGHHGSASSTSFELLEATKPQMAVICVGKNNNHGHPTQEVLVKLKLFHTEIYRTDIHGTILFRG